MASSTSSPDDNKKEMETSAAASTNQEHLAYVKSYLKAVRGVFQYYGEETKFDEFIKLLVDYLNCRIGSKRLVKGASELLECHPVLILGFNSFLPKGYEIAAKKLEPVGLIHALAFTKIVEERFRNNTERYESFLNILKGIRFGKKSLHDSFKKILDVFHDNYDLLDEFGNFLPNTKTRTGA